MASTTKRIELKEKVTLLLGRSNESLARTEILGLSSASRDEATIRKLSAHADDHYTRRTHSGVAHFMEIYERSANKEVLEEFVVSLLHFKEFPPFVMGIFGHLMNQGPVELELKIARMVEMLSDIRLLEAVKQFERRDIPKEVSDNIAGQLANAIFNASLMPKKGGSWRHVESMVTVMNSDVYRDMVPKLVASGSDNTMEFVVAIAVEGTVLGAQRMARIFSEVGYSKAALDVYRMDGIPAFVRRISSAQEMTQAGMDARRPS